MKNRLALIPQKQFREAGLRAAAVIPSLELWQRFKTVLLFRSMETEIDTQPLLETALKENKRVFLPRIEEDGKMIFCRVTAPDLIRADFWQPGPFGIQEPNPEKMQAGKTGNRGSASCGILGPADFPALVFTPGLAFDRQGNRLGRGRGFYDRFLAENRENICTVGLCMEIQTVPQVPCGTGDQKVAFIFAGPDFNCLTTGD